MSITDARVRGRRAGAEDPHEGTVHLDIRADNVTVTILKMTVAAASLHSAISNLPILLTVRLQSPP